MKIRRQGRLSLIAAALVVFSFLSAGGHGDGDGDAYGEVDDHDHAVQFYMNCLAMYERHNRGDYFSDLYPEDSFSCGHGMGEVCDAYGTIGRLRPAYVEALNRYFNSNQTLIDMEICSLDDVRARENIRCAALPKTFIDDMFFLDDEC
ncbi:hypothetical protein OROHE_002589 [Orobanche hederae]